MWLCVCVRVARRWEVAQGCRSIDETVKCSKRYYIICPLWFSSPPPCPRFWTILSSRRTSACGSRSWGTATTACPVCPSRCLITPGTAWRWAWICVRPSSKTPHFFSFALCRVWRHISCLVWGKTVTVRKTLKTCWANRLPLLNCCGCSERPTCLCACAKQTWRCSFGAIGHIVNHSNFKSVSAMQKFHFFLE